MNNLYGDIIEIDEHRCPVYPDVIVAYRSGKKIGVIRNVNSLVNSNHMMEAPEISFDVHKKANGIVCDLWDDVKDFRLIYVPALDAPDFNPWYELHVTIDEYDETVKHCECFHIQETELSQLSLHNIEINTESDIDRDDYVPTKIYDSTNPDASLLDRLLKDKASHYSIHHVDGSIAQLQRTFSWNDSDIKSAFDDIAEEVECIFIYGLSNLDDGKIHRTISVYDLNDVCLDCGERGVFENGICTNCGSNNIRDGYGLNSGIFINAENFASEITYTSNADDVKNCFRLEGGDDIMTDAIRGINPTLSQYIWYLGNDIRSDMSPELQSALTSYDNIYRDYESTEQLEISQTDINSYNTLVNKYSSFDEELETVTYPIIGYSNLTDFYYKNTELHSLLQTTLAPSTPGGEVTTADIEAEKLSSGVLSSMGIQNAEIASSATVNSAIINYAKVYFDSSLYGIKIKTSSYNTSTHVWTGVFTLTSYSDEDDTADTATITTTVTGATAEYLKTLIEKTMKKNGKDATGTVALFELSEAEFETALSSYSLDNLSMFAQIARSCIDVLIDQGCATEGSSLWGDTYNSIYLPYYRKSGLIESELSERESEVSTVDNILKNIEKERSRISNVLNLKSFLGDSLWEEFCSFRRDGEYRNENYISDGLDDKEIIINAQEFMKRAQRDLVKSATLQHTISCNLNDLLLYDSSDKSIREEIRTTLISDFGSQIIDDDSDSILVYVPPTEKIYINNHLYIVNTKSTFAPLLTYFKIGNWIRIEIDNKIFKLRMTDYTVTYDDLATLEVEFSDVTYALGAMSDISSILSKSASMSTSYSTVSRQAGNGQKANAEIVNMVENGLYLTNKKIANAENQNLTIDESGMLVRQQGEYTNGYLPEQVKIINKGLYFTDDNWLTAKAAIGKFDYYDPSDGIYKEGYGVIAEKIVGNLILGNNLGIYNESGSFKVDQDGIVITASSTADNSNLFTIQKDNGNGTYTKYLYLDSNGILNMELGGSSNSVLRVYDSSNRIITAIDRSNFYVQSPSAANSSNMLRLDLISGALKLLYNGTYYGGVHNNVSANKQGTSIIGLNTVSMSLGDGSTATLYYRLASNTAINNDSSLFYRHNFWGSTGILDSVLYLSSTTIDYTLGVTRSANQYSGNIYSYDKNNHRTYYSEMAATTTGTVYRSYVVTAQNSSGTTYYSGFYTGINADGSAYFSITGTNMAASMRAAIGALSTGGGTATGNLAVQSTNPYFIIKNTSLNVTLANNNTSSTKWHGLQVQDTSGKLYGYFCGFAQADGKTGAALYAYNYNTSGSQVGSGGLCMYVDKSGTVSYSVTNAAAFRTAIGANSSGVWPASVGGTGTTKGIKGWTSLGSTTGTTAKAITASSYTEILVIMKRSTNYWGSCFIPVAALSTTANEWYCGGGNKGGSSTSGRRGVFKATKTAITPILVTIDGTDYADSSVVTYIYGR